jgi:glyoxylase-like metal-dependent hydrolase (beta-lactamase superfamily II)
MASLIAKLEFDRNACNTYLVGAEGQPCVVIDPGSNAKGSLDNYIEKHHRLCLGILLTHGHFDHIGGLRTLKHRATVFMGEADIPCLEDGKLNGSGFFDLSEAVEVKGIEAYALDDGDEIKLGGYLFKVLATPFHTKGSVCFYLPGEKALFSGDTLFHLGIGRTDMPGGSERTIDASLRKLLSLPPETKVYPGHGENTTLGNEFAYNEAFQRLKR